MGVLQNEMDRVMSDLITQPSFKAEIIRHAFQKREITLTESQFDQLVQAIESQEDPSISFEMEIEGSDQSVELTSDDFEAALADLEGKWDEQFDRVINRALVEVAPNVLDSLYADAAELLGERRSTQSQFEARLRSRWKEGLDGLEILIIISRESGEIYVQDVNEQLDIERHLTEHELELQNVLAALHIRACRTASEVLCLLKCGYADGANARWRSLHEIAVTAFFLGQFQGDTPRRYLDHAVIDRIRSAERYQEHCGTLGYEPFSEDEIAEMKKEADAAVAKYGESFRKEYGWASEAIGKNNPRFTDLEAALDMSHWRPHYKLACQSVHAGSQGLHYSLGVPEGSETTLISGASNAGLAEPGQNTAISLTMVSAALLTSEPNLDSLIACRCMQKLSADIGNAFWCSQEELDREVKSEVPT